MAGDWIKMRNDLADDPAVIAIAAAVGLDEFAVVGRLHTLWAWADEQSRDGHAAGVTSAWLDRKVQRDGFAAALVSAGWLEITDGGVSFANFENHNGATAKTRALATRRKQVQRADSVPPVVAVVVTPASANGHATTVTKARPEKRREEKKEEIAPTELADRSPEGSEPPTFDGKNAEALNGKTIASLSGAWELPEAWGVDAEALGWKPREVLLEAEKFRQYWTAGKGAGTRRAVKGWRQTWSNWLGKAAERRR